VADYIHADCVAVHVGDVSHDREAVERHMSFARNLRIETHMIPGDDIPGALAGFARAHGVTQIFIGRSARLPWWKRYRETTVQQLVRQVRDMQITIVAERRRVQ
jgi:K+-sensing histidine kinase KdpD